MAWRPVLASAQSHQVMKLIAARHESLQQLGISQAFQQFGGYPRGLTEDDGNARDVEVRRIR